MKKKNGFTLVELLAVIIILALILALIVPKVFKTIDDSKVRSCNIQLEYIKDAAATYFAKYRYKDYEEDVTYDDAAKDVNGVQISLRKLVSASLLKGTINNPVTDKPFDYDNTYALIKNVDGVLSYTILVKNSVTSNMEVFDCESE